MIEYFATKSKLYELNRAEAVVSLRLLFVTRSLLISISLRPVDHFVLSHPKMISVITRLRRIDIARQLPLDQLARGVACVRLNLSERWHRKCVT
jgi:hypothetical protein